MLLLAFLQAIEVSQHRRYERTEVLELAYPSLIHARLPHVSLYVVELATTMLLQSRNRRRGCSGCRQFFTFQSPVLLDRNR